MGSFVESLPELLRARVTAGFGTIDLAPDKSAWKVSGNVQPAALWQQLQQFADIPQPGLQGDVSFQSRIAMLGETIQLTDLQVNSSDVKASSSALEITPSNPVTAMLDGTVHVEGTGAALKTLLAPWHDASWLSDRANVVSDLTATPTREIELAVRITPENVANLQRTNVLSVSRPQPRSSAVSHSSQAESSFAIDEADVQLSMLAKNAGQQFDIRKGSIKLPGLLALIQGTVSVPDEDLILDLTADTTYDLDILSRRLLTPDSGITISGQGKDVFRLTGSPSALSGVSQRTVAASGSSAPLLKGSGNVAWASANAWGLQIGEANVQASLENSLLRSTPIQCSVNGGQLNIMPQYDLAGSQLQLGTGSRVQNLQLTPELCRTWLGYVAPMLADTAEVNGTVSARVERFLWDFNAPENSDVQAQLTIHQAEASPGSSLSSLLEVVDLLRRSGDASQSLTQRSLVLPEQTIPVQVRQGYVAHDGLVMDLNGYRMRTSGAVGLNKQLQMTIDVPLEKSTADGAGRSIKVPLRGTISSPQPDTIFREAVQHQASEPAIIVLNDRRESVLFLKAVTHPGENQHPRAAAVIKWILMGPVIQKFASGLFMERILPKVVLAHQWTTQQVGPAFCCLPGFINGDEVCLGKAIVRQNNAQRFMANRQVPQKHIVSNRPNSVDSLKAIASHQQDCPYPSDHFVDQDLLGDCPSCRTSRHESNQMQRITNPEPVLQIG